MIEASISSRPPAVLSQGLRKTFGGFAAVDGIDLEIPAGANFALLGPNGAGKSTLIRMLTTLIKMTSGKAFVDGHDVAKQPAAVRHAIGVVPQALTSDPDLTALENLDFHAKLYSVPRAARRGMAEELLAAVDLLQWRDKRVGTFSGGMRRRLEVARSLMHRPRVLFLDEPTTGLDPASRIGMWEMIRNLKVQTGLTILLTTHYMEEAEALCERVAIVDHGRLVALGTPAELEAGLPDLDTIEVRFEEVPEGWAACLHELDGVIGVVESGGLWRLRSLARMETAMRLLSLAKARGIALSSLVIRGYDLEDVFVAYTGRDPRDRLQDGPVRLAGHA